MEESRLEYEILEYKKYNENEILPLYKSVGWTTYTSNPEMLRKAFENSLKIYAAYVCMRPMGIIRAVGDGHSIVYIQDLLVHPNIRRNGIGWALLMRMMDTYKDVYQRVLLADHTLKTSRFYKSMGFQQTSELNCKAYLKVYHKPMERT